MADINELNRAMGRLESSVSNLSDKYDDVYKLVKRMDESLSNRKWWDSVKIFSGAYCGGITAVLIKQAIFGG